MSAATTLDNTTLCRRATDSAETHRRHSRSGDSRGWLAFQVEEELIDTMNLNEFLIGNKEATYMLEVSGDSVIDAGIMPGDLVLVKGGIYPKDGDIDDTDNPKLPILARRCSPAIYPPGRGQMAQPISVEAGCAFIA